MNITGILQKLLEFFFSCLQENKNTFWNINKKVIKQTFDTFKDGYLDFCFTGMLLTAPAFPCVCGKGWQSSTKVSPNPISSREEPLFPL